MEFGLTYFPEYFTLQVPEVHKAIYSDLKSIIESKDGIHYAAALPRGYAKTTILDFLFPLYCICFKLKRFIVIISSSQDLADSFLSNIKDELEFNELLVEDFGCLKGDTWNAQDIITSTGIEVRTAGSGSKVRGLKNGAHRPDLVIMDDLENDEGVRSPEQRKKLKDWFWKAISKVGTKFTDFIFLGTILHFDSLLVDVLNNPAYQSKIYSAVISFSKDQDHWAMWESILTDMSNKNRLADAKDYFLNHKSTMLEGTKVLWEAKYNYYDLMVMKVTEGEASFNTEMQNNPVNPETTIFNEAWFKYFTMEDIKKEKKQIDLYAAVDASMGKKNTADYSAIIVLGKNRVSGQMYCLEADLKKRHPDAIIEDVADILLKWQEYFNTGFECLGVEDTAFQSYFKDNLVKALMKKDIYVNVQGLHSQVDKQLRIEKLQPDIKNGYIKFMIDQKLLLDQLKQFPLAPYDDGPDALEMCRRIVGRSIQVI